jgi:hypothetical protein
MAALLRRWGWAKLSRDPLNKERRQLMKVIVAIFQGRQRRGNLGSLPIRYTRMAAVEASSRYKSVTDNQPGRTFKDPRGGLHLVPDQNLRRIGKKSKIADKGARLNLRDL